MSKYSNEGIISLSLSLSLSLSRSHSYSLSRVGKTVRIMCLRINAFTKDLLLTDTFIEISLKKKYSRIKLISFGYTRLNFSECGVQHHLTIMRNGQEE